MSSDASNSADLLLRQLAEITRLARLLQAKRRGGDALAADPVHRPGLEKTLADFDRWHGPMLEATRELGKCRDLLRQVLKPKRLGRFL